MIKKILLGLVVIVVILVVVIALQSSTYHVERTATINAPPAVVFAQVNDFHKWNVWSPGFGMCVDQFGIPWMVNCEEAK